MTGRIIEVADDQRHLSLARGFMQVHASNGERELLGQVPLDDIAAVIANAHGISYTNNLLVALAERGAPFVLCGANHNPVGMLLPIDGNYQQALRFDLQIAAKEGVQNRLWAELVKAKLQQQAGTLEAAQCSPAPLQALVRKVRSGDPDNLEAQGARKYWGLLIGEDFRRDQNGDGINAMLNYGYTVLRAAMARAVVAAGLHPTLGLHHSNQNNAMRLVDDLIEPFRPLLDLRIWHWRQSRECIVNPASKRYLVHSLYADMYGENGVTPVLLCMQRLATSLAQVYMGERNKLDLPLPGLPLDFMQALQED